VTQTIFRGVTVTRDQVLRALDDFKVLYPDDNAYENWRERKNHKYALVYGDRLYPPKRILSLITGKKEFEGGKQETNRVFRQLGFTVIDKP
jgi:5-methylcytosine-specific restriction protein A